MCNADINLVSEPIRFEHVDSVGITETKNGNN